MSHKKPNPDQRQFASEEAFNLTNEDLFGDDMADTVPDTPVQFSFAPGNRISVEPDAEKAVKAWAATFNAVFRGKVTAAHFDTDGEPGPSLDEFISWGAVKDEQTGYGALVIDIFPTDLAKAVEVSYEEYMRVLQDLAELIPLMNSPSELRWVKDSVLYTALLGAGTRAEQLQAQFIMAMTDAGIALEQFSQVFTPEDKALAGEILDLNNRLLTSETVWSAIETAAGQEGDFEEGTDLGDILEPEGVGDSGAGNPQ